ncbi:MAG: L-aspartate oxidase [Mycobacteriaceae bacterium]
MSVVPKVEQSLSISWEANADFVVVGGGVAGLSAALTARKRGSRVLVVSKLGPTDTSTFLAQGGIAVVGQGDSIDSHVKDTCAAGAGLCDIAAVRSIIADGQDAVERLTALGAHFDATADGSWERTREGGHSTRRIIHAGGDATGAEVQRALNSQSTELTILQWHTAAQVMTDAKGVTGLLVYSEQGWGVVHAPAVLLATGGLGHLFSFSTNPPGSTGDGVALALDAGACVVDLEFIQFHPTVLYTPSLGVGAGLGRRPLISEAVRGEGAILLDTEGNSVTAGVHPLGDLAPRDVVSRAIAQRLQELGTDHVLLDARVLKDFPQRFPTITLACEQVGIDPTRDFIPVAPAAHYSCGGVLTDVYGRTEIRGLYAAGEVARTGLNGANRLASNSLLEGLVMGKRVGEVCVEREKICTRMVDPILVRRRALPRVELQSLMTAEVGVTRDRVGLDRARDQLNSTSWVIPQNGLDIENSSLAVVAEVLVLAASERNETRGCHTRTDYPEPRESLRRSTRVRMDPDGELAITELQYVES